MDPKVTPQSTTPASSPSTINCIGEDDSSDEKFMAEPKEWEGNLPSNSSAVLFVYTPSSRYSSPIDSTANSSPAPTIESPIEMEPLTDAVAEALKESDSESKADTHHNWMNWAFLNLQFTPQNALLLFLAASSATLTIGGLAAGSAAVTAIGVVLGAGALLARYGFCGVQDTKKESDITGELTSSHLEQKFA